ncbi:Ras, Miro, and/or UPF0079 domain containing protein [Asbolus verrucosus]|uniref:Rab-like protein 3 n=1 Tax=Asbolus verrucosus TaxID=1661398 RepID=A0A482W837_ASBVE|nr:Ras, Miro, and/or UPF0079 domain containing protein [Asbolus verrucosus]
MTAIDRVRVMVLGDSGVGKTSFVQLAANSEPIRSPSWTVGCSVEVKLHEYKEGTKEQKTYFIEFWDVGGSNNHRNTRHVFYNPCHGVILVHDLTNRKSEANLHKWLQELIDQDANSATLNSVTSMDEYDTENFFGATQMPILVIGTKLDQVDERKSIIGTFASQFGADEIVLDSRQARYLAAGSSNAVKLSRFYDKVIEMRYHSQNRSFSERFGSKTVSPTLPSKFYSPHQD